VQQRCDVGSGKSGTGGGHPACTRGSATHHDRVTRVLLAVSEKDFRRQRGSSLAVAVLQRQNLYWCRAMRKSQSIIPSLAQHWTVPAPAVPRNHCSRLYLKRFPVPLHACNVMRKCSKQRSQCTLPASQLISPFDEELLTIAILTACWTDVYPHSNAPLQIAVSGREDDPECRC
jgi:hypothetical protein